MPRVTGGTVAAVPGAENAAMTKIHISRRALLLGAAATVLLGTLVFLFLRTEAASYKSEARALTLLRELKDYDTRWDIEAQRLVDSLASPPPAIPDRDAIFTRILLELDHPDLRRALGNTVQELRDGMAQKTQEFRKLRAMHAQSLEAHAAAREALRALAAEGPAARARNPRALAPSMALTNDIERVRTALRSDDLAGTGEQERSVEPVLASLVPAAQAVDPMLASTAARAESLARAFLRARAAEAQAWNRFTFLTVGSRIGLAQRELSAAIDRALDEKDRWRAYLTAYAAALLLGVGYLAARVMQADAALRLANQELERRVVERTADLTSALHRLKESEAQLVQTEKMSSLGQLVAGVAHEINTPLAYVKSNVASVRDHVPELREVIGQTEALLAMLQDPATDSAALQECFTILSERLTRLGAERMFRDLDDLTRDGLHGIEQITELVTNLRNFSRLDRSKIASFNVNDGVTAAFLIARPLLRKIDVEKRLSDIPAITCSPSQVNQVVLNIVTNAAQAMDKPRGQITVETRPEGIYEIAIDITDNGRGIPPENLGRIFDPFFTTKAPGTGTGLGLSIAYKIVKQHGGRIDVTSTPGEGSTFNVVLPIQPPPGLGEEDSPTETAPA